MRLLIVVFTLIVSQLALIFNVFAAEPLNGYFIANEVCEAFQSKNKRTNPGDIHVVISQAYKIYAINEVGGDYYQIKISGAPVVESRWVHVSCGVHVEVVKTAINEEISETDAPIEITGKESIANLLALSWQPAFCEYKPNKAECKSLNNGELSITETQFSLHGLWPQPRGKDYCGVSSQLVKLDKANRWTKLPAIKLSAETKEALNVAMPGTASFLQRHEWIKHGTCYQAKGGAEEYFSDTLSLLEMINQSIIAEFMANHVGSEVATADIRKLFDKEFGVGVGDRVQFHCKGDQGRILIREMTIELVGQITQNVSFKELALNSDPISIGCTKGYIDPAGLQ